MWTTKLWAHNTQQFGQCKSADGMGESASV